MAVQVGSANLAKALLSRSLTVHINQIRLQSALYCDQGETIV
ncbi:MAG TPA: hypothetical protein VF706_05190 [Solirubrobacteraceae bacterium]